MGIRWDADLWFLWGLAEGSDRLEDETRDCPTGGRSPAAIADGRLGAETPTMRMISWAMCALTMLALLPDAVRLAAAANAVRSGWWPSSLVTRTVMSHQLGGSFARGTASATYYIPGP